MISRRTCLFSGAGALLAPGFARAADPWKKNAAEWSDKDIQQIVTKSPWAKEVAVEFKGGGQGGNWGGGGGGRGRGGRGGGGAAMGDASVGGPGGGGGYGGGGGGMGPGGGGGGYGGGANPRSMENGPGGGGGMPQMRTTVRWESSKAIRDARKKPIRPEDAPFYILSVGPLPSGPAGGGQGQWGGGGAEAANASDADRRKWLENKLKESTRLERKGQDPIVPDRVMVVEGNGMRMLVFYFARTPHPIQAEDKEVTFATALGPMEIKAKFPLKDMAYGSELAL